MPQVELIATKPHVYGGKSRKVGDPYHATRQDAEALVAIGRAKRAPTPVPRDTDAKSATHHEQRVPPADHGKQVVETKDLTAETDDDDAPKAKRKYVRRDLEAE